MIHYITTHGVGNAWVGNELRIVGKAGIPYVLHSLRPRGLKFFGSDEIQRMENQTRVIYPLSIGRLLLAVALAPFHFRGRFVSALKNALFSERESFTVRLKCFGHFLVACWWARNLKGDEVTLIHSQWIHSCGTVGMYGAWLLGVPFGFTGHAADLFRDRCALRDKIKQAKYIICISNFHRDFFLIYGAKPQQLKVVYCGIDVEMFSPKDQQQDSNDLFTIVASGRLVEKKGFEFLIDACKLLEERLEFRCIIAGSGELGDNLNHRIRELGLENRVKITGKTILQEKISVLMHDGDCYCLPCIWASDNDVDGLPQMLMEAMACGLPVVSTKLVGIPDLVIDGETGLLIEYAESGLIADAIEVLYHDRNLRRKLAENGRKLVEEKFNLDSCLEPLLQEYTHLLSQGN